MPILQPFAVKTVVTETDLELTADPGEAFRIWDILTFYEAEPYFTARINKTTVGYFRSGGPFGGHQNAPDGLARHSHNLRLMPGPEPETPAQYYIRDVGNNISAFSVERDSEGDPVDAQDVEDFVSQKTAPRTETLLSYLRKKGIWKGWPVAEGETFALEGIEQLASKQVVVYEILEPGDISPEDENGSKSNSFVFINYGNCGGNISSEGDHLYTTSKNPAEFPDFPFGRVVPAKHQIEIMGILGSAFAPKENENDNHSYTRYLKIIRDREVLFDEDRNGIPFECRALDQGNRIDKFASGISMIGNYSKHDHLEPLIFDPPLVYEAGDEVGIYVSLVAKGTGKDIAIDQHEIGLIERVTRLE
ncbi:hypothetical protein ES708_23758 [subsurface metagenome]